MARERPEGPREASAACASTSFCAHARECTKICTWLCKTSRGVFESKRTTCLCGCAIPVNPREPALAPLRRRSRAARWASGCHHGLTHGSLTSVSRCGQCCRRPLAPTPTCAPRRASGQHLAREKPQPTRGRPAIASQTESPPRGRQGAAHRLARLALQPSRRVKPLAPPPTDVVT